MIIGFIPMLIIVAGRKDWFDLPPGFGSAVLWGMLAAPIVLGLVLGPADEKASRWVAGLFSLPLAGYFLGTGMFAACESDWGPCPDLITPTIISVMLFAASFVLVELTVRARLSIARRRERRSPAPEAEPT